jgi:hypothetical protein
MCKLWKCKIDDPIFEDINTAQWIFYSNMLSKDKIREYDTMTIMADYLASFWNPEGVKKVQEIRNSQSSHSFQSDRQFEESMVTGEYKNNPLLDAFINMRKKEKEEKEEKGLDIHRENKSHPKSKLPTDLSSIRSTLSKFDK